MSYKKHSIVHLIEVDPKKAADQIVAVLRECGMHRADAAKKLGCSHVTLLRWIERLKIDARIQKLDAQSRKEGWFHGRLGGRPARVTPG